MNQHTIPLGRIWGIPIGLDYSWFLIFILMTWTMAAGYYPAAFPDWSKAMYWIAGAATAIMLFVSVLLHELGHSVVARHYKIPVERITLFIFGGISYLGGEPSSAVAGFWVSIAGPAVSFGLAALLYLMQPILAINVLFLAIGQYLSYINLILGIFNLIPGFPLDGGGIFRAVVWKFTHDMRRSTLIAAGVGRFIAFLFIIFGVWQILAGKFISGMWITFIGFFLESAAKGQVLQMSLQDALTGHKVSQVMNPHYLSISPDMTLQNLIDDHILSGGRRSFIVTNGKQVIGLLTLHQLREVPRINWPSTTVAQVAIPANQMKQVLPETDLWEALKEMDHEGVNQLPVIKENQILGILSREDVIGYLRTLQDLGLHPLKN